MGMSMPMAVQSRVEVLRDVRVHGLTGSTIDATAVVVSTCSASADCIGSVAPMCSAVACAALSCDGGCFTPDGAVHGMTG